MKFNLTGGWYESSGPELSDGSFDTSQMYIEEVVKVYASENGLDEILYYGVISEGDLSRINLINNIPVEIYIVNNRTGAIVDTVTAQVKYNNEVEII